MAPKWIQDLFLSSDCSDVQFSIPSENITLPAHSLILSGASPVFKTMFYGSLRNQSSTILLPDISANDLREVFRYIYTEKIELNDVNICGIINAAHKYSVEALEELCHQYIEDHLNANNVLLLLEGIPSTLLDNRGHTSKCWNLISQESSDVLQSSYFREITVETMEKVLSLDCLSITEEMVFWYVLIWTKKQCELNHLEKINENQRKMLNDLVYLFDFRSMSLMEFMRCIDEAPGFFTDSEIVEICKGIYQHNKNDLAIEPNNIGREFNQSKLGNDSRTHFNTAASKFSFERKVKLRKRAIGSPWNLKLGESLVEKDKNKSEISFENTSLPANFNFNV